MSEDRLTIIEGKVDKLMVGQAKLGASVDELSAGQAKLRTEMQADDAALRASIDDLGHQMLLLHEDTIEKIKALAPDFSAVAKAMADPPKRSRRRGIRSEFKAADAELREKMDSRLTPLEVWARNVSKRLGDRPEDE